MKRSYDLITPVYDPLAKLFIGRALREAQICFLPLIPPNASILIVGGGTGWLLEEMAAIYPQGLHIDYVDSSANMIALSKQRKYGRNQINFIHQPIAGFLNQWQYDVIITPFFFDNFKEETMQNVFALLHRTLKPNGLWLYTDFQVSSKHACWQKAVLFIMYSFFRMAANIETARLPDVVSCFSRYQYYLISRQTFKHQFIITSAYKKQG